MKNRGAGVNMALMDDDLEEGCPTWDVVDDVLIPPDHDLGLGLPGQGVHEAVVKLGGVLGCAFFLVNVGLSMYPDLLECQAPIVVDKVDEILIRLERILWDHQDTHPSMPDCSVLQGGEKDLDPVGFADEGVTWKCLNCRSVELGSFRGGIVDDAIIDER